MTQKNQMSARALTMAELENVNGGSPCPTWWDDQKKKGFEIRVK
jgi:hypothetical protein